MYTIKILDHSSTTVVIRLPEPESCSITSCCVWQWDINEQNVRCLSEVKLIYQVPSDSPVDGILK